MATYLGSDFRGNRKVEPPRVLIDAVSYALDRTYGPGTTSFKLRSGITPGTKGFGTSSGRHTPLGAGAGDFQIFDASGRQMAGKELVPFAQNWVSNFGSIGVNMYPGEKGPNFTHLDFITPTSEVKRGQDQFWTYPSGALSSLDGQIQKMAGGRTWLDGQPPDDTFAQLDAAANYIRETRVANIEPGKLASLWGRDPLDAPVVPANLPAQEAPVAPAYTDADAEKLAGVMLAEARGEGRVGMLGVGWTVANRIDEQSKRFPDTVGEVLSEYAAPKPIDINNPIDRQALEDAKGILARDDVRSPNPVGDAVYFHNPNTSKSTLVKQQTDSGQVVATIGDHVFVDNSKYLEKYGGTASGRQATLPPDVDGVTFGAADERSPPVTPVDYAVASTPDEVFTSPREARAKADAELAPFAPLDIEGWGDTGTTPGASAFGVIERVPPFDITGTMTGGPARGASDYIVVRPDAPMPRPRPVELTGWADTGTTPGASASLAFRPIEPEALPPPPGGMDFSGSSLQPLYGGGDTATSLARQRELGGGAGTVTFQPLPPPSVFRAGQNDSLSDASRTGPARTGGNSIFGLKPTPTNDMGLTAADMAFKPLPGGGNWSPTATMTPPALTRSIPPPAPPPVYAQDKPSTYYDSPFAEQRTKDDNIYDLGGQPYDMGGSSVTATLTPPIDPVVPVAPPPTNVAFQPIGEPMDITPPAPAVAAPPPPAVVKPFAPPPNAAPPAQRKPGLFGGLFGGGLFGGNSPIARVASALFGGGGQAGNAFAFTPSVGGTSPGGTNYVAGWGTGSGPAGGWTTQWTSSGGNLITTRENPYTGVMETTYG